MITVARHLWVVDKDANIIPKVVVTIDWETQVLDIDITMEDIKGSSQTLLELPKDIVTVEVDMVDFRILNESWIKYNLSSDDKFISFQTLQDMEHVLQSKYKLNSIK